ncbi:hypothetical protein PTTG_07345 [Puccinia triticina 1-1 BBBD Race 1]|uniref:Uncharacterized protein n=2 Tax=Puccinia triticina TaxID=208348 RepID=A0A0C4F2M4_PUCT1|nr:uncharacterized protein PtA15_1A320 [Puccinia triticina]OAV90320.1 hypothetical protein PTTG_07345 [Puccinia triticina 1-1 BBBD Race 1]WAQ80982.1 hypothetical protein PtA15_1A320 [Puccinia triticina]
MQFIRFVTLITSLVLVPAFTLASCHFKHYAPRNKTALATCIPSMKPSRVDNSNCGSVKWYLSQSAWASTDDCYNLCASCLFSGISAGASEVSCRKRSLFAHCHVGYF